MTAGAENSKTLRRAGQLTRRVDYIYKSTIQYDYGNSPLVAQDPYGLVSARITRQPPHSRMAYHAFGTNLTDTHYAVGGLDDGPGGSLGEVVKLMGARRECGLGATFAIGRSATR